MSEKMETNQRLQSCKMIEGGGKVTIFWIVEESSWAGVSIEDEATLGSCISKGDKEMKTEIVNRQ